MRGAARLARRRRMALIDRETISIPLYVFIISRSSRRFNIETGTWDECRYSDAVGGDEWTSRTLPGDEAENGTDR